MNSLASYAAQAELTRVALGMLEIPFEPAAASSGELFDTVIDALSGQLIACAGSAVARTEGRLPHALCEPSLAERRRSKRQIREGVLSRKLTGQREVLARTPILLRAMAQEIDAARQSSDVSNPESLCEVADRIERLADSCCAYAVRHVRIKKLLRAAQPDLEHLAESAARNERTLVRELIRVVSPE